MNFWKEIVARQRQFFRKRRFSMHHAVDNSEEWYLHLSPANLLAAAIAFVLLLFILTLSLVAYTPVLEFLPGYRTAADSSRENLVRSIIRLDSMERVMQDMMTYNEHIAQIMEGRTPVARINTSNDSVRLNKPFIMPSHEDSLLRAQMEGEGVYALRGPNSGSRRSVRESFEMITPTEGIIVERFDIREGHFGVQIAAASEARVAAIEKGIVIQSLWTPDSGNLIIVQHDQNLISIYKHLSQALVTSGQPVRAGELIGYTAKVEGDKTSLFGFELWSNCKPVDPEGYILF